jgi:hypothetical protein
MSTDLSVLQQTSLCRLSTLFSFYFSHYPFPLTFPRYLILTAFFSLLCPSNFPRPPSVIPLLLLVVLHHFPLIPPFPSCRIIIFFYFTSSPHSSRSSSLIFSPILFHSPLPCSSSTIPQLAELCIQDMKGFK